MKLFTRGKWIAGGILLLLGLSLLLAAALLPRPLQSQLQAERWAGESGGRFAQFDCILAPAFAPPLAGGATAPSSGPSRGTGWPPDHFLTHGWGVCGSEGSGIGDQ